MSYASSWILLQFIIIPQPQPHYGLRALNKQRKMVFEEDVTVGFWMLTTSTHIFIVGCQTET